jgi:hypothetical protein
VRAILIPIVFVVLACGRMPGDEQVKYAPTDMATVQAVLDGVLERLDTEFDEHGAEFVKRVAQVKQEVVVAQGFEDWREFSDRVRLLSPERGLWLSTQITKRLEELLESPYEPSKTGETEEDE